MEDYGLALKKLRKHFGYTQADLAVRIGVTNQAVSKWENGINQPDISMLRSICAILGITTEQFFRVAAGEEVAAVLGVEESVEGESAATEAPVATGELPVQAPRRSNKALWISVLSAVTAILLATIVLLVIFLPKKPILDGLEKAQVTYYVDGKLYSNQSLYEGGTPPTPEKKGHEFLGWYTRQTGGEPFDFNDFGGKETITLYARFQAERYQLTFTSALHDTTFEKQVKYGEAWAFPTDGFTHENFNLVGWTGYGNTYALGARGIELEDLYDDVNEFTFRAKWEYVEPIVPPEVLPVSYTVTYTDGARGNGDISYAYYDTTDTWALPACDVTYEGYTFKNWYCPQTKAYYSVGAKVIFTDGEAKEFVAQWTPITYTVKYVSELHDTPFYREYSYGTNYTSPTELAVSKEGYMLVGWEINGTMYEPNEIFRNLTTRAEELTATAIWRRTLYWICVEYPYKEVKEFGPYDWEASVSMPSADTFTPPSGYVFDCWVRKNTGEQYAAGQTVTKLPDPVFDRYITSTQSGYKVEFEVRWKTVTYTVNFLGNGATGGEMQPQTFSANELSRLNKNTFTKDGYLFAGWDAPTLYFNGYYSGKWDETTSYYGDLFIGSLDGYYLNENRIYNFATMATEFDFKARWVKALQGAGTSSNPYLITSVEDLQALSYLIDNHAEMRTAHYKLTTDLTFTNQLVRSIGFYTSAQGAESIGFAGVFDGDGHILKNITYDSQANQPVSTALDWNYETFALFGYVSGGTVKNLGVFGGNTVYAGQRFGGIVGRLDDGGVLERCGVNISANLEYRETSSTHFGGMVSEVRNGTVRDCYVFGTMLGTYYTDSPTGEVRMGGLVAAAESGAVIERCYTNVSIRVDVSQSTKKARHYLGGLIGSAQSCTVKNCFVGGYLYAKTYSDFTGLIIGYDYVIKSCENVYWESYNGGIYLEPLDASIQSVSSKIGSGKTFNELYSISWLTANLGFDSEVWQQEDMAFPTLKVLAGNLK